MALRHKFGAKRCEKDGIKFPSLLEGRYFEKLKRLQEEGVVTMFLRQPLFDLVGKIQYRADFLVFYSDGTASVIDCKGVETKDFIMKKKMVEATYPIEIEVVKKV